MVVRPLVDTFDAAGPSTPTRQQRVQIGGFGPPRDDALQHVGEPGHRLNTVQLGGLDEGHGNCPVPRPAIASSKQCIVAIEGYRPDGALDHVRVHLDPSVVEEQRQAGPMPQGVADGYGQVRGGGDAALMGLQPVLQGLDDRSTSLLPHVSPGFGGMAADLALDRIKVPDPRQHLGRQR